MQEEVKQLCINGLETDGAHHKQWYLEQILVKLGFNVEEILKEEEAEGYYFERGIAP